MTTSRSTDIALKPEGVNTSRRSFLKNMSLAVTAIHVDNGEAVEFDQPLISIA